MADGLDELDRMCDSQVPVEWLDSERASPDEGESAANVVESWARNWPGGRLFASEFRTPANVRALGDALTGAFRWFGPRELELTFESLRSSGKIVSKSEAAGREREAAVSRKKKYSDDCEEWTRLSSTAEIRARVDSDPAYKSWFAKNAGRIPTEQSLPLHPDVAAENKRALAAEQERLERLAEVPEAVRRFAQEYRTLSTAETRCRMNSDPEFSKMVTIATNYGLL